MDIGHRGVVRILPDKGVGPGHGGLGYQEADGERPVILTRGCCGDGAGNGSNNHAEQEDRLSSNTVHRESDHCKEKLPINTRKIIK